MHSVRKDLQEIINIFGKYEGDLISIDLPNEIVKVSLEKHKDDREARLLNLIELCNKVNASIVTFNLIEGKGIVELENGTPSSVYYNENTKAWN